ncbi:hypothetical protein SAMN05421858_0586 [Haladaptatus litoreus]|uniref:Uncharacterized protein n=1 Tax=Haladaptatus litoreus TaxID=553468 RepID=A0A1N6W3E7_9EURY|nr:hypothetical protein [Haladaptatus litoreus]SIQ84580.1 hypothetical protein SAMN05421858_0586 [Haladaptatus litoreus]
MPELPHSIRNHSLRIDSAVCPNRNLDETPTKTNERPFARPTTKYGSQFEHADE